MKWNDYLLFIFFLFAVITIVLGYFVFSFICSVIFVALLQSMFNNEKRIYALILPLLLFMISVIVTFKHTDNSLMLFVVLNIPTDIALIQYFSFK